MRKLAKAKSQREPTIALINIVFLMLVFFMVAGTLAHPIDAPLSLIRTTELDGRSPPDALVVHPDATLSYRGTTQETVAAYLESLSAEDRKTIRLVPDRALPADALVRIARDLRNAGAEKIMIVTERGLE
ncbi:ExbD/TolR family protein [Sedimentitalea nanhaiensis]|uniref:Biopolymer transport protein ExbD n=1 Tax=Sedimentitalea nanhaiensis TaxID=999627 RepID=A0A1I7DWD4_9RHOB|nr:biopolymer transporter ExbD [Sedimentitalea nanhaiensis]SFU15990.1 biopolymer transport protein ExbD [Sedimentitalea nanhaiensis]